MKKDEQESVKFKASKIQRLVIDKIVYRAFKEIPHFKNGSQTLLDLAMDLNAVHSNDVRLDFNKLLKFDTFNFIHDVTGINGLIDRNTGKLKKCFLPRSSKINNRSKK